MNRGTPLQICCSEVSKHGPYWLSPGLPSIHKLGDFFSVPEKKLFLLILLRLLVLVSAGNYFILVLLSKFLIKTIS